MKSDLPPIVIMAYNRPAYLKETLLSLASSGASRHPLFMFVDGPRDVAGQEIAASCERVFKETFPAGKTFLSPSNLGIANNFRQAERFIFEQNNFDAAYFFEDDMVVSHRYLEILNSLTALAQGNPRIGAFAAYGFHDSERPEEPNPSALVAMKWNWGFGITKSAWKRREALIAPYYDLIAGADYRQRPFGLIGHWLRVQGFGALADNLEKKGSTSQDVIKKSALAVLGAASVMPAAINAHYIGEKGENFTPSSYAAASFTKSKFEPEGIEVAVTSDLNRETQLGVAAQDGHSGRAMPKWLVAASEDVALDDLLDLYGVDAEDRSQITSKSDFYFEIHDLRRKYPSINRKVSDNLRKMAQEQLGFVLNSSISTISVCHERKLKTGFHFTVSPHFFVDFAELSASKKFKYIEICDFDLLPAELESEAWMQAMFQWLQVGGAAQGALRADRMESYSELLNRFGFVKSADAGEYIRVSVRKT